MKRKKRAAQREQTVGGAKGKAETERRKNTENFTTATLTDLLTQTTYELPCGVMFLPEICAETAPAYAERLCNAYHFFNERYAVDDLFYAGVFRELDGRLFEAQIWRPCEATWPSGASVCVAVYCTPARAATTIEEKLSQARGRYEN